MPALLGSTAKSDPVPGLILTMWAWNVRFG